MAQDTTWSGNVLSEADINAYLMGEGNAWTAYTPTLTQSATPTKTVTYARYARFGRLIVGNVSLAVTSAGTAANAVVVGLPVASVATLSNLTLGTGWLTDASAATVYIGALRWATTTTAEIWGGGGVANALGVTQFTAALASGDTVAFSFHYEAAS